MLERWRICGVLVALVLALHTSASGQAPVLILGVLEDNPGHYAGAPHYRAVRVIFRHAAGEWEAFPSNCSDEECLQSIAAKFPPQVEWTIAFDGRSIGHVAGRTPQSFDFYSSVGQQEIVGDADPPAVGKRSTQFAGFPGEAVYRPLIALSQPEYRDPDGWKRTPLPDTLLAAVRRAFRAKFPKVENCTKTNAEQPAPWSYLDKDIRVQASYGSTRNWFLARLSLEGYRCDGPPDEAFEPQSFVIAPDDTVRWLDSNIRLVDAGDYDNDGKSELVFSIDANNRGGYKLYYNDFGKSVVFEFSYH